MYDFLKNFDGSGRTPRKQQVEFLQWLSANWSTAEVFKGQLPVGSGKSAITKAIQLATGAQIIVPSNQLMTQVVNDYPQSNFLKGKAHYFCRKYAMTCADSQALITDPDGRCKSCVYNQCKEAALEGEPTFFNPMSLYYLTRSIGYKKPSIVIADESHTIASMMSLQCTQRFRKSQYNFDSRCESELFLVVWLQENIRKLNKLINQYRRTKDFKKIMELNGEMESMMLTKKGLEEDAQNFAIWIDHGTYRGRPDSFLNIKPIKPPRFIINRLLGAPKVILLSATNFGSSVDDLVEGRTVKEIDLDSPIPKESRPVFYKPVAHKMNRDTSAQEIVTACEAIIDRHPGVNTLIHTTYGEAVKLAPLFKKPVLYNTQENKDTVLKRFIADGGIFLASACTEGLDLKEDLCRLNIIYKLSYPNLGDPIIKKRMALPDGQLWYATETMRAVCQAVGRSTRGPTDWSNTYILDPSFPRVYRQVKHLLPKSFCEAIVWSTT